MDKSRTILIPIDFSETSENTVEYVLKNECKEPTKIILLHTYRLITEDLSHYDNSPFALKNSIESQLKDAYNKFYNKLALKRHKDISFVLEVGFLGNCINTLCKESQIDLIVFGIKSESSNTSLTEVISSGYCPILIILEFQNIALSEKTIFSQTNFLDNKKAFFQKIKESKNKMFLIQP